jgi:Zn-dependent peptidase ImmA (M78 family)/predicted secreted protein
MGTPPFMARRRHALQAATELLDDLDIDQEQPVDVFEAIARLGLWLVFQPLTTLLGAVVPQGSGGIMITTEREPAIQRYTAAHEVGHWALDHNRPAFDTESDILRPGGVERELVAQWFASYFLMPPPLVHATVSRYLQAGMDVSPPAAYLVARDMRVSYEAALRQMANLDVITDHQLKKLLNVRPLRAKQELAYGHRPQVGNADVWPLVSTMSRTAEEVAVVVAVNDEIVIALPETRSTDYRWLDDATNARRAARQARPAPPPFAPLPSARPIAPSRPDPPRPTKADIDAALALLPGRQSNHRNEERDDAAECYPADAGLALVFDEYRPGWARITARDPAPLRRHIAAAATEPTDFLSPAREVASEQVPTDPPDPANPGVGAMGQRVLALRAYAEGHYTHVLHYAPVHDPHALPAATFTIDASVAPPPGVLNRRALMDIELDNGTDTSEIDSTDRSGDETHQ